MWRSDSGRCLFETSIIEAVRPRLCSRQELRSGAGKAVRAWVAQVASGRAAGCRHRVVDLEGDWLAGEATAGVELVWTDAEDGTWSEWATLAFARTGRIWHVTGAVRARRPA